MPEKHLYKTSTRWQSERKGTLSSNNLPDIGVAAPPEFPGGHPGIWSPEHLFTAAAEICLMTTFLAIAAKSKLEFLEYTSEAEGVLEKTNTGFLMTEITLRPRVAVASEDSVDKTRRLIETAEAYCLISNSMKTQIKLEPTVVVQPF
ncbi:MAG: OsmC family peroxiredoxin [Gammaproteobacteria bacterium]|nr:OsmC family peroxiredoxin [Gammaproteobacteria bacterium]